MRTESTFHSTRSANRHAPVGVLLLALLLVTGCGENAPSDVASPRMRLLSERIVAVDDVLGLYRCLDNLGTTLRKHPGRNAVSLACAAGTYRGRTGASQPCELQVDGVNGEFRFQVERQTVRIRLDRAVHGADGSAVYNLEDASAPAQPGIQLTRFTGGRTPTTEALILRFGTSLPALPHMLYQRSADGPTTAIICVFGK